jgi:hypothetical protein
LPNYAFLLDEHMKPFSGLPLDLFGFDLIELRAFNRSFVSTATPDWILYLAAAAAGLTGLITNDEGQLAQENEARALDLTGLAVVTYRKGVQDELTKWELLMAYAPRIVKKLDSGERGAIVLPAPGSPNTLAPKTLLHEIRTREKVSAPELRHRADRTMQDELARRKLDRLWPT